MITSHRRREQSARAELGEARRRAAAAEAALAAYRTSRKRGAPPSPPQRGTGRPRNLPARRQPHCRRPARSSSGWTGESKRSPPGRRSSRRRSRAKSTSSVRPRCRLRPWPMGPPATPWSRPSQLLPPPSRPGRSAVAELAAADDESLVAEQPVSELRARHSDLIACRLASPRTRRGAKLASSTRSMSGRRPKRSSASCARRRRSRRRTTIGASARRRRRWRRSRSPAALATPRRKRRTRRDASSSSSPSTFRRRAPSWPHLAGAARRRVAARSSAVRGRLADAAGRPLGPRGVVAGHRGGGRRRARERAAVGGR